MKKAVKITLVLVVLVGASVFLLIFSQRAFSVAQAVKIYTFKEYDTCRSWGGKIYVRDVTPYSNGQATAKMTCFCGYECSISCKFSLRRDLFLWTVENKQYDCGGYYSIY